MNCVFASQCHLESLTSTGFRALRSDYGNVKLHDPAITSEDVERTYEQFIDDGK